MSSETDKRLLVLYLTPVTAMFVRRSRRLIRKHRKYYGLIVNSPETHEPGIGKVILHVFASFSSQREAGLSLSDISGGVSRSS